MSYIRGRATEWLKRHKSARVVEAAEARALVSALLHERDTVQTASDYIDVVTNSLREGVVAEFSDEDIDRVEAALRRAADTVSRGYAPYAMPSPEERMLVARSLSIDPKAQK